MEKLVVLAEESGVDPSQSAVVNTGLQDATAASEMDEMHSHVWYKQRVVTLTYSRKKERLILHRRNKKGKTVDMVNISTASIINVETPEERILRQLRSKNMNDAQGAMFAANSKPSFHGFFKMSPKDAETLYPCSMSVSTSSISFGNHSRSADGAVPGGMMHSSGNASRSPEHARSLFYLHLVRDSGSSTSISTIEFSSLPGCESHHALQHIVKTVLGDTYPHGAKKLILFVSPKSGSGKALDITERHVLPVLHFSRHEVSTIVTKRAFHCEDYIAELGNDITDKDVLVCVGGDGMIHEAVNGLFRRRQALLKREAERRENEKRNSDDSHPENQKNREENNGKLKEIDTRKSNLDCKKNKVRSEDIGGIGEEKRENGGSEIMRGKDKDGDAPNSKGNNKDILKLMEFGKPNSTTSAGTKFSFPFIATIPTGSGCGMAKTLGITDIKKSIIALVHLKTCVKDLMKMNYILGENMKADFPLFPHSIAMDVRDTEKEKDVPRDLTEQEEEKSEKQITAERIAFMSVTFGILNKIDRGSEKLRWMGNSRFTAYGAYTFLRGVRSYGVRLRYLPWIGSSGQQVEKLEGEGFIPSEKEFPRCTWTTACKHCQAHRNVGDPLAICSSSSSADKLSFSIDGLPHTHAFEAECDPVDFDDDSLPWATLDGNHYAIFVSNICSAAKDILMTPLAHMSDGAIDIVFTREKEIKQGRSEFLKFFTRMDTGSHVNLPFVSYIKARALELEANEGFLMSDGEVMPFTKVQITPLRHVTEFVRVG